MASASRSQRPGLCTPCPIRTARRAKTVSTDARGLTLALVVLDGWGHRAETAGNAIATAAPRSLDAIARDGASTLLEAAGRAVGLPDGVMGNSEVGHLTLGAGRVVDQDLVRIARECSHVPVELPELQLTIRAALHGTGRLHWLGLCSDAGVHSDVAHLRALVATAASAGVPSQWVHCFTDGRDTPPDSAPLHVGRLEAFLQGVPGARIATVSGRYHGMDRDGNWDRVERAARAIVHGEGPRAASALAAIEASHARGVTDEFILPTVVDPQGTMRDGDAAIFVNFRADRARQLTRALVDPSFHEFELSRPRLSRFATLTDYGLGLGLPSLFPPEQPELTLGEVVAAAGWPQLRLAETEKYAHVTYFFNGGREAAFEGEERILVPSPRVATFDLAPAMAAREVTDHAVSWVSRGGRRLLVCNLANADMVGHTGRMDATVAACRVVDDCVERIADAVSAARGVLAVTADHGNAERMVDDRGRPHTAHTTAEVPLVLRGPGVPVGAALRRGGLADVAPTLLALAGIAPPAAMTGRSLLA